MAPVLAMFSDRLAVPPMPTVPDAVRLAPVLVNVRVAWVSVTPPGAAMGDAPGLLWMWALAENVPSVPIAAITLMVGLGMSKPRGPVKAEYAEAGTVKVADPDSPAGRSIT